MSHYGVHWEWRGFGHLDDKGSKHFDKLEPRYADLETDEYLWLPGCSVNVKIRSRGRGSLKLKRCHRVDNQLRAELWLEDKDEDYPFPVSADAVRRLAVALGLALRAPSEPLPRAKLLEVLAAAGVQEVAVKKLRRQYNKTEDGVRLIVEWAQVLSPEKVDSIAIESEGDLTERSSSTELEVAGRAVARARDRLPFAAGLRHVNYLEALAVWAKGGHLLPRT